MKKTQKTIWVNLRHLMPANLNKPSNIYVLIDEAHRTTGGDLGNFLMAGLPNATFLGFTGTPVDKTVTTPLFAALHLSLHPHGQRADAHEGNTHQDQRDRPAQ